MKYSLPCLLLLLAACSRTETTPDSPPPADLSAKVLEWNAAHASRKDADFQALYADTVLYYGTAMPATECIRSKSTFFSKHPDFRQALIGGITLDTLSPAEIKCSFLKQVSLDGKPEAFPSYLVFRSVGNAWKIVTEGDAVTDRNLSARKQPLELPAARISGDFNGDGKQEEMWLRAPEILPDEMDCPRGECTCRILFSTPALTELPLASCIGGMPVNEGDLNGDGSDEIGLLPEWFTSCWHAYHVWTWRDGRWQDLVDPISTHCMQWEEGVDAIEKDPENPGYVIVRSTTLGEEDFEIVTERVQVQD